MRMILCFLLHIDILTFKSSLEVL